MFLLDHPDTGKKSHQVVVLQLFVTYPSRMLSFARFTCIYPVTLLETTSRHQQRNDQLTIIEQANGFGSGYTGTPDGEGYRTKSSRQADQVEVQVTIFYPTLNAGRYIQISRFQRREASSHTSRIGGEFCDIDM
jgi:hypothetical protein